MVAPTDVRKVSDVSDLPDGGLIRLWAAPIFGRSPKRSPRLPEGQRPSAHQAAKPHTLHSAYCLLPTAYCFLGSRRLWPLSQRALGRNTFSPQRTGGGSDSES
jgi:hypothetical protein